MKSLSKSELIDFLNSSDAYLYYLPDSQQFVSVDQLDDEDLISRSKHQYIYLTSYEALLFCLSNSSDFPSNDIEFTNVPLSLGELMETWKGFNRILRDESFNSYLISNDQVEGWIELTPEQLDALVELKQAYLEAKSVIN